MTKNMGNRDKGIRVIMAIVVFLLFFFNVINGALAYILMALAIVFLLTSFISFCPLYAPFGISSCKSKK